MKSRWLWTGLERYGLAVTSVLIASLLKMVIEPLVEVDVPFVLFLGGILVTAWYGGFVAGVVASVLAASLFALDLDASVHALAPPQRWVRALAFGCEGAFASLLVVMVQRFRASVRRRTEADLR